MTCNPYSPTPQAKKIIVGGAIVIGSIIIPFQDHEEKKPNSLTYNEAVLAVQHSEEPNESQIEVTNFSLFSNPVYGREIYNNGYNGVKIYGEIHPF